MDHAFTAGAIAWRPSREIAEQSNLLAFLRAHGLADYDALIARSNEDPEWFWNTAIRHLDIRFYKPYARVLDTSQGVEWARWCVGGTTNIVLNCLDKHRDGPFWAKPAILWEGEDGARREWTYAELAAEVSRLASALRRLGLGPGDAVGLFLPMVPEVAAAFFAVAKIGGIVVPLFSGFGKQAIAVRLNDCEAKAVITVDGTLRRGKRVPMKATLDEALDETPSVKHVIVFKHLGDDVPWRAGRDHWWHESVKGAPGEAPTEEMDAEAPFMVIHTSGTTGKPKGTVHTHCGFLTKIMADMILCHDFQAKDRLIWMSDMGWIVGPLEIMLAAFAGATLVLAEGTPDYPDPGRLWRLMQEYGVTYLGIAPTVVRIFMAQRENAAERHDLSSLRITTTTGEPWTPDAWRWFFEHVCKKRVPILNLSGGTEIGGGIVGCVVTRPLKPCSFNAPLPAMGADVVDENAKSQPRGEVGELVLRLPSIGLSRGLWKDADRYLETYWSTFPGLWRQGDWATVDGDGMWYILGRSDDTLKVAGKRTGPAEIEGVVLETGLVKEAAAIGVPDKVKGSAVVCVCVPGEGVSADAALKEKLADAVVAGHGKAFRPKDVVFVTDLPKTRSMKIMRRVVRSVYLGQDPGDLSSLVNPSAIEELRAKAKV